MMKIFESAQPLLYHASFHKIRKFWPLSHFGTYRAALSRIIDVLAQGTTPVQMKNNTVYLYPVRYPCDNPLVTSDIFDDRPMVVGELSFFIKNRYYHELPTHEQNILNQLTMRKTTPRSISQLVHVIQSLGYDCIKYKNRWEDPGSFSFMNLTSDQVQVLAAPLEFPAQKLMGLQKSRLGTWREPKTEQMNPHQFVTSFDIPDTSRHNGGVVTARHSTLGI